MRVPQWSIASSICIIQGTELYKMEIITPVRVIMPRRAIRARKQRPRRPVRRMRKRVSKKTGLRPQAQYAKIVETFELPEVYSDKGYNFTFSLNTFYRATTLAKNFRFYKAAKVKWEYMPFYNTFQEGNSTGTVAKPQLYFMMNRDQNNFWQTESPTTQLFAIQSAGADPMPLTSNKEIVYRPNWCSPGISALAFSPVSAVGGGAVNAVTNVVSCGLKKQYGWLPTPDLDLYNNPKVYNPTTGAYDLSGNSVNTSPTANAAVVYNGHDFYIQQVNEPNTPVCKVVCTVEWLFKGSKNNYTGDLGASAPTE